MPKKNLSWILPNTLAVGGIKSIKRLRENGIKYVINLSGITCDGKRRNIPLKDSGKNDPAVLLEVAKKLKKRIDRNKRPVYVHCLVGRSRSVSIIALYLALHKNDEYASLQQALKHIKEHRKQAHPNTNLWKTIKEAYKLGKLEKEKVEL